MRNKEEVKFSPLGLIGIVICFILLALAFASCSTRKVNKSEVKKKTEVTVQDSSRTERTEQTTNVIIDTTSTTEIEIEPVDNTKPFTVNNKTYFNARIKVKKIKNGVSVAENKKVSEIEQKAVKTNIMATKVAAKKETEAKRPFSFWWIFIIVGVCYLIYRKYLR